MAVQTTRAERGTKKRDKESSGPLRASTIEKKRLLSAKNSVVQGAGEKSRGEGSGAGRREGDTQKGR